jgi:lipopolysaccharide transport system permease protein
MPDPVSVLARGSAGMIRTLAHNARLLVAITRVELSKRYAGSVLGMSWLVLQPALYLSVYLFVYLVLFKGQFVGYTRLGYVLYVFCGLVPYLGTIDAISLGAVSIKQNIHLVKNVMLPIELVPVRAVLVASASQAVGLAVVILLSALNGSLTIH